MHLIGKPPVHVHIFTHTAISYPHFFYLGRCSFSPGHSPLFNVGCKPPVHVHMFTHTAISYQHLFCLGILPAHACMPSGAGVASQLESVSLMTTALPLRLLTLSSSIIVLLTIMQVRYTLSFSPSWHLIRGLSSTNWTNLPPSW